MNIFGFNGDVDAAVDIWAADIDYPFPLDGDARLLAVTSDNAADDQDGTGAKSVLITGLDGSGAQISETVLVKGTAPQASTQLFSRVNSVRVASAGHSLTNVGVILVKHGFEQVADVVPQTLAHVPAGYGSAPQAVYSVPANYNKSRIKSWRAMAPAAAAGDTIFGLMARPFSGAWSLIDIATVDNLAGPSFERALNELVAGRTDLKIRCLATDSGNLIVSAGFQLELD